MSKMTLGTAQFGMNYGIKNKNGQPPEQESIKILDYANQNNINSFDTASAYGTSEIILGSWLKGKNLDSIEITTKLPWLDSNIMGYIELEKIINRHVEESLQKLGLNKINHYLIHNFLNVREYKSGIFEILEKLKTQKIIGSYGCSIYDIEDLEYLNQFKIGSIQIPGSIFNQRILNSKHLSNLRQNEVKVFVRSAFVQGLLFMNEEEVPLTLKNINPYLNKLKHLTEQSNITVFEAAFNFVRNHPNIDKIVFGVDSLEQLNEIIMINSKKELDTELINKEFGDIPLELVDPRFWR